MEQSELQFAHKWWALAGLSILSFTSFLDYTIVNTAIPYIQKSLEAPILQLQWVSNIYAMIMSMFMIVIGRFTELFGKKRVFYSGAILFAIAAMIAALSPNIYFLIGARALQGFGAAVIFTASVTLIPLAVPKEDQEHAVGIYSGITGIGLAAGPFLGGILIALFSWRWVFWINIPIVAIGLILCILFLEKEKIALEKVKIDFIGLILLIVGLGCLNYGIIHGGQIGWSHLSTILNLLIGAVALVVMIIYELKAQEPMLDFTIFNDPLVLLTILSCIIAGIISFVLMFYNPLYLSVVKHLAPFYIGLAIAIIPLIQIVISFAFKPLLKGLGIINMMMISLISALAALICHFFIGMSTPMVFVLFAFLLLGINWGISNAGTVYSVHQAVPHNRVGTAIGTVFTTWNIAGSLFLAGSSAIFDKVEYSTMLSLIQEHHLSLSDFQMEKVKVALSEPSKAISLLREYIGAKATTIIDYFYHSFLSGYHAIIAFLACAVAIILILGFVIRKKAKKEALSAEK